MRRVLAVLVLVGLGGVGLTWSAAQPPTTPTASIASMASTTVKAVTSSDDGDDSDASDDPVTLTRIVGLSPGVQALLNQVPAGVQTALLVKELSGRQRLLEAQRPDQPFIPASTMKLITTASMLYDRGGTEGWWSTELTVPAAQVGKAQVKALTLRSSGDPTLSIHQGPYSLRVLAKQVYARGVRVVGQVRIDDARLNGSGWQELPLQVPMTAPRLKEWYDQPPTTAATARTQLGTALKAELRRAGVNITSEDVGQAAPYQLYIPPERVDANGKLLPPDPVVPVHRRPEQAVATVRSSTPTEVLNATQRPSDNLRAEELLATLGVQPIGGSLDSALARERAFLRQIGVDMTHLQLADGSGLSRDNRLTARALVHLLETMYDLPYPLPGKTGLPVEQYRKRHNAFIESLPQAGTGENTPKHDGRGGTLAQRLIGSQLDVRAKTGTLPGVSALAGYVTAKSGQTLAFAILMNGPDTTPILTLRAQQDQLIKAIAAAH